VKVLFDVLHPAHVHFFRALIEELKRDGHQPIVASREKDVTTDLLDRFAIPHHPISRIGKSKSALLTELCIRSWRLARLIRREKPTVLLGIMGAFIAPLGALFRIPSLVFYATESATLSNTYVYRTCTRFITPECFRHRFGPKHFTYPGSQELAWLHPNRFQPDPSVLDEVALAPGAPFTIVRLVSWGASHDIGHQGLSPDFKQKAIERFQKYGTVFISSESPLPREFEKYRLNLPVDRLHSLIHFASLVFGESATLAAEAAMLGTPAVYLDNCGRGFTDQLEEFELVKNFTETPGDQQAAIDWGAGILANRSSKEQTAKATARWLDYAQDPLEVMKFHIQQVTHS